MLVLSVQKKTRVYIGEEADVYVERLKRNSAVLSFTVPKHVSLTRCTSTENQPRRGRFDNGLRDLVSRYVTATRLGQIEHAHELFESMEELVATP